MTGSARRGVIGEAVRTSGTLTACSLVGPALFLGIARAGGADCWRSGPSSGCCKDAVTICGPVGGQFWGCTQDSNTNGCMIRTVVKAQPGQSGYEEVVVSDECDCQMTRTACGSSYGECIPTGTQHTVCNDTDPDHTSDGCTGT